MRPLICALLFIGVAACAAEPSVPVGPAEKAITIERLASNPIIRPDMLPGNDGENINGPSLIRAPSWMKNPLGRYYLYFAHHNGTYIRLAYADALAGPWRVHEPGTLKLEQTPCVDFPRPERRHVASPDVQIDEANRKIRLYFHCPVDGADWRQPTFVATSSDGLNFDTLPEPLGHAYFRLFRHDGYWYALGMPGVFYRSHDGLHEFERGPTLFDENMRHSAIKVEGDIASVFYTQVGESPERILLATIDLSPDWMNWEESQPIVVLEPETEYEGAALKLEPSERGSIIGPVRQLRDPAIFREDGMTYLLYSVAGEHGIAIAELK